MKMNWRLNMLQLIIMIIDNNNMRMNKYLKP